MKIKILLFCLLLNFPFSAYAGTDDDVIADYTVYWGITTMKDMCESSGHAISAQDKFLNDNHAAIENLIDAVREIKDDNGNTMIDVITSNPDYRQRFLNKLYMSLIPIKKLIIVEKLAASDPVLAGNYMMNLQNNEILIKYGDMAGFADICLKIESTFATSPEVYHKLLHLDKYVGLNQ